MKTLSALFSKLLILVLCLALLVTVPVSVRAEEAIDPSQIPMVMSADADSPLLDAVTEIIENMIARKETFSLELTVPVEMGNTVDIGNLGLTLFFEALVHTGNPVGGDYLLHHISRYGYGISYYSDGDFYYCTLEYQIEYLSTAAQEEAMNAAVAQLLAQLDLAGKSDYEKVRAVYDYMTANITYDYAGLDDPNDQTKYTAYGALVEKNCVCQGYASLFYRLMLELGIDARVISGIGNGGRHGWNIVQLNGLYYNLDATWDASWVEAGLPYAFFLQSQADFDDHYRDGEFDTPEFHTMYPMAPESYQDTGDDKVPGDMNGDGDVNNKDLTRLFQYLSGYDVEVVEKALDVNDDGSVNNKDLTRLFQYLSGYDVEIY